MQLRVEVHGLASEGPILENAYTVNVSRSGARLIGSRYSQHPGDTVELRRGKDKARYQVMWVGEPGTPVHGQLGLRSLEPVKNIWSAPLPPPPRPVSDIPAPARSSVADFSEAAFSPSAEPRPSAEASVPVVRSVESLPYDDESALAQPAEDEGDTVSYGPQLMPESYITAETPPPLHRRPILYVGLVVALAAGLGLGWLRSGSAPDEAASGVSSAEASATAPATLGSGTTTPAQTEPAALPPAAAPAQAQPAPVQTAPAAKPAPKKESAPAPTKSKPVEVASRTQPAPMKSGPAPTAARTAASAFAVQVGAYGSAATAQALAKSPASRYDRKGIVDAIDSRGRTLHRVRLSSPSEADARALVARIRREQNLDAIVVRPE